MKWRRAAVGFAALGAMALTGCMVPGASLPPGGSHSAGPSGSQGSMPDRWLEAHNLYRFEVEVPPLAWSENLAIAAQAWANHLATTNTFVHSDGTDYGENLWKGTAGAYAPGAMVTAWGDEKDYFIPNAAFPNLSTTGNWADVGHYTQIVWRDTTHVGCGLATGSGFDVLVCRYSPPGNYRGQRPF